LKNKNKGFLGLYFSYGFPPQFSNKTTKTPTLLSTNVFGLEDSKFVDLVL
jgi:hypothetical protein